MFQYSTSPTFTPTAVSFFLYSSAFNASAVGVAVDGAGDAFVADTVNSAVDEFSPNNNLYQGGSFHPIGSGFSSPKGVAVDAAGDVFVADTGNNAVKEVLPDGTILMIGSGFNGPRGVAVDTAGDVFVADTGNNAVEEVLPSGTILMIGSGFNGPRGVAVDTAGDVFVADTGNNAVKEVLPSGTVLTLGSGFNGPSAVAVDVAGDVFVADTGNNAVKEVLPNSTLLTLGPGFFAPRGVAVDAVGDVLIAAGGNTMFEVTPPTVLATPSPLTGTAETAVSATLTGLTPGTTYYDRVVGTSAVGEVADTATGSFTTPAPPSVTTNAASPMTTGATLNATVNPNGSSTTARFQYSTSPAFTPTVATTIGSGFSAPCDVAVDAAGDVFVTDQTDNAVYEVLPDGTIKTIGSGFLQPSGVAVDAAGDAFIADTGNNAVKEVLPDGTILTVGFGFLQPRGVAVDGADGNVFIVDGGSNVFKDLLPSYGTYTSSAITSFDESYQVAQPLGVAVDAAGDVYVADTGNNAIVEVQPNGNLFTIGSGFKQPSGVAVDAAGDVFVADSGNNAVKEVLPNGTILTIGSGFNQPSGVAVDAAGDVFVADSGDHRVVELSPPSVAATPSPLSGTTATAVSATLTGLTLGTTYYDRVVATNAFGTVADSSVQSFTTTQATTTTTLTSSANPAVYGQLVTLTATVSPSTATGTVTFYDGASELGTGTLNSSGVATLSLNALAIGQVSLTATYGGDASDITSTSAALFATINEAATTTSVVASAVDPLYGQAVTFLATVAPVSPGLGAPTGTVSFYDGANLLGTGTLCGGTATFTTSAALALGTHTVTASYAGDGSYLPSVTGTIESAAGDGFGAGGSGGYTGDGGPSTDAELNLPIGVAVDSAGDLFIADWYNSVVREVVKATGDIVTFAGERTAGYSGDGGPATAAELSAPEAFAVDASGNVLISDTLNNVVREVVKATGDIVTFAGNGSYGYGGDGGPATSAELSEPRGLAFDAQGNLYIADVNDGVIREVVQSTGDIVTFAGNGGSGDTGDGGAPTAAQIGQPSDVIVDPAGDVYICDEANNVIREVVKSTGLITTVAGNGTAGYSGDGGPATTPRLAGPWASQWTPRATCSSPNSATTSSARWSRPPATSSPSPAPPA